MTTMPQREEEEQPDPVNAREQDGKTRFPILALLLLFTFGPILTYGFVTWDDPILIWFNPVAQDWLNTPWSDRLLTPRLGYPTAIPTALYALALSIAPAAAPQFLHGVSLLLHMLNAALLLKVANLILDNKKQALLAAGVWALHPITVEAVAWASDLKELLYTLALFASLLFWDKWLAKTAPKQSLAGLLGALAVGFLSKPTALIIPFVMLAYALVKHPASMRRRENIATLTPLLLLSGFWWWLSNKMHNTDMLATAADAYASRNPLITILKSVGVQFRNYTYPLELQPYYPEQLVNMDALAALGLAVAVGWMGGLAFAIKKKHQAVLPLLLLGLCWAPYSNLSPLPRFTSDTYMYTASAFISIPFVKLAFDRLDKSTLSRYTSIVFACIWIIFSGLTLTQVSRWSSTSELWGPLLGQPEKLATPYQLIAYEKFALEKDPEGAAELLVEAWEETASQSGVPGFAWEAFLAANRPEWAARALIQGTPANQPARARATLDILAENQLPIPKDERPRALELLTLVRSSNSSSPAIETWAKQNAM